MTAVKLCENLCQFLKHHFLHGSKNFAIVHLSLCKIWILKSYFRADLEVMGTSFYLISNKFSYIWINPNVFRHLICSISVAWNAQYFRSNMRKTNALYKNVHEINIQVRIWSYYNDTFSLLKIGAGIWQLEFVWNLKKYIYTIYIYIHLFFICICEFINGQHRSSAFKMIDDWKYK